MLALLQDFLGAGSGAGAAPTDGKDAATMRAKANGISFNYQVDGPEGAPGSSSATRWRPISPCGTSRR